MRVPTDLSEIQLLAVKVIENGEELVNIRKNCPNILIHPLLQKNGSEPYVRKTIAKMLNKASSYLPEGIILVVRDAYRSNQIQGKIYNAHIKRFKNENPSWSVEKLKKEANKFAADPDDQISGGHTTGAAVDVTLAHFKTRRRLKMKTAKLPYIKQTAINSPVPKIVQRNRYMLFNAMTKAGFVNYPNEWWHYSYGDIFASARSGRNKAVYDRVESL